MCRYKFDNLAIHEKKLLATSVPQNVLHMLTSEKGKLCTGVEKSCACVWHTPNRIFSMLTLKKLSRNRDFL